MPANNHLTWTELKDFRPGLWTLEPLKAPASAATLMNDCYPGPSGGLYPFLRPVESSSPALPNLVPTGFGTAWREDQTGSPEYFITGVEGGGNKLYRAAGSFSGFALVETNGPGVGSGEICDFAQYVVGGGAVGRIFFSGDASGAGGGVGWRNLNSGAASNQLSVNAKPPLASHQGRLVCCDSRKTSILFTDPGGTTLPGGNTITPDPGGGAGTIVALHAFSPSDLVVVYASGSTVMIQGDLSDPTVRTLGRGPGTVFDHAQITRMSDGSLVMPFQYLGPHIFNGESWTPLNVPQQMDPSMPLDDDTTATETWGGYGSNGRVTPQYLRRGPYLFTPFGYIYDERTKSWFRATALSRSWFYSDGAQALLALEVDNADNAQVISFREGRTDNEYPLSGSFSNQRAREYAWQSVPLRHPEGELSSVREVEVFIENQNRVSSLSPAVQALAPGFEVVNTVTVTVNGVSRSATTSSTRQFDILRFQFPRGVDMYSTVKVEVETTDNGGDTGATGVNNSISAPPIESIRIGFSPGRQLR